MDFRWRSLIGSIRTLLSALVAAGLLLPAPAAGQTHGPTEVAQWETIKPLFKMVEDVAAGLAPASDIATAWQVNFVRADSGFVIVPFTIQLDPNAFTTYPLGMYIRIVLRGAPAPAPGPRDALAQYPFEDAAIVERPTDGRINRAFVVSPGEYDVYIGLRDGVGLAVAEPGQPAPEPLPAKAVVIKQQVDVPDFGDRLSTSSVFVLESNQIDTRPTRPNFEEQLDDPYAMWGLRMRPALRRVYTPQETLAVLFLVYNAQLSTTTGKPDVEVRYSFLRKAGTQETFVTRTAPELLNSETLGPNFNPANGDVIIAGKQVPLSSFSSGDYRLEITVVDKTNASATVRDVNFSVRP
ncbi:MAG: hypothetical protein AB7P22_17240 [Vicinamibacterales bacterium]